MVYRHILAAYDGSDLSKAVLAQAVNIVQERPITKLTVLHVLHFPKVYVGDVLYSVPAGTDEAFVEYAESSLEEVRSAVKDLLYAVVEIRQGSPAETILEAAEEKGCDLIMMGSRGLSGLKELMLGSVSHAVVQKSPIPVLIIK